MPTYLWRVRSPEGTSTAERVRAPSPEAARAMLESRGFTELKLQNDDFTNVLNAGNRADNPELENDDCWDDEEVFTAEEELEFTRSYTVLGFIWNTIKSWSWALVPVLLWNGYNFYRGFPLLSISSAAALALLALVVYFMVTSSACSLCYDRLLYAVTLGHWTAVAFLIRVLRFLRWFNGFGVPRHELIFRQAQVLFEKSGLEAAVQHYSRCEQDPVLPKPLYWSRLSQFYFAAQNFPQGLEWQKRAFEEGTGSSSELIDRAYHLVHYGRDPLAARELLAQVEGKEIVELAQSYLDFVHGMVALRENRLQDARNSLEAALQTAAALRIGTPLLTGHIRLIEAYLCLVCGRLGEKDRSERLFDRVAKFLKTAHELALMEECRATVGAQASSRV